MSSYVFMISFKQCTSRKKGFEGTETLTLTDHNSGRKYKTTGSGMDLKPTLLAEWVTQNYQEELLELPELFCTHYHLDTQEYVFPPISGLPFDLAARKLVATFASVDDEQPVKVTVPDIDYSAIFAILHQMGVYLEAVYDHKGQTSWICGYIVQEKGKW